MKNRFSEISKNLKEAFSKIDNELIKSKQNFDTKNFKVQKEKFMEYKKAGQKLTANRYVEWFLENLSENIKIPYRESNLKNKLVQLAQINNRKLKKAFE